MINPSHDQGVTSPPQDNHPHTETGVPAQSGHTSSGETMLKSTRTDTGSGPPPFPSLIIVTKTALSELFYEESGLVYFQPRESIMIQNKHFIL
jgi:hypothetical protein